MPYSYRSLIKTLSEAGIAEPADEARCLFEAYAHISYSSLLADRNRSYVCADLDEAVAKRLLRYPLQYILGTWDFYGCTFTVNEHCLIPRPDTEILVDTALQYLPPSARFADLCTGSGCIAVATLSHRKDTTGVALELYPQTLALAEKNAVENHVSDRFIPIQADLLSNGFEKLNTYAPFDAILSNPPYIRTQEIDALSPEVLHEPRAALDGGEDGLIFYRAILHKYVPLLRPGSHIILEIGFDQGDDLHRLAIEYVPNAQFHIIRDLAGQDRVAVVTLPT